MSTLGQGMLGKRPHASTQKLMKDAEDAFILKTSQSALLGGSNPKLNNPLFAPDGLVDHEDQASQARDAGSDGEDRLSQKDESEIGDSISQLNLKQQRLS